MRLCAVNNGDFSCDSVHPSGLSALKDCRTIRPTSFSANHAALATHGVFANDEASPRRTQGSCVHLSRPASRARLCTVDRTRLSKGHRNKSSRTSKAPISLGLSLQDDLAQHLIPTTSWTQCMSTLSDWRVYSF